jgi:hypothetical protein
VSIYIIYELTVPFSLSILSYTPMTGRHGRDRMIVRFKTTKCNHCLSLLTLWVRIPLKRGVLDTTLSDKVCQWLSTGLWFSLGTPVSSTNKTDRHDIAEILLKVVLNTITLIPYTPMTRQSLCKNKTITKTKAFKRGNQNL